MGRKDKKLHKKNNQKDKKKESKLAPQTKQWIKAILMFLVASIVTLAFFNKAGIAGQWFVKTSNILLGDSKITITTIILFLFSAGFVLLKSKKKINSSVIVLSVLVIVVGIAGISANQNLNQNQGGLIGWSAKLLVDLFGILVSNIIFLAVVIIGLFIFLQFIWQEIQQGQEDKKPLFVPDKVQSHDFSKVKIKGVTEEKLDLESAKSIFKTKEDKSKDKKPVLVSPVLGKTKGKYSLPPIDLLSKTESSPTSGNIKENSFIIKKTLENFGIPVEMAEVNVGPTVTQYAFKPAEGVKLSKITTLSNNLALALAAHPIRIEAPIPGKSLVGIEVPNKIRATVTLRNLIDNSDYRNSFDSLVIALGRDVSGNPVYTDLAEMPHLLVAGATGTGKTIFLNSLILSFLYKHTPETLRIIMVDPKRVEFQHYNEIPHLLCPVVYDAQKTMNVLQWLTREMERRFEVFSEVSTRNIKIYNQNKSVIDSSSQLPYIILIIDELADLMVAKGRELEAGIVRLAQMARATGIHLVLATQRPSVEVITGLIKANITSRITFQVASQVDSRTVLDTAGAEKLLGSGDMLFLSSKSSKISRIQAPYTSEKEVKKVVDWIAQYSQNIEEPQSLLVQSLGDVLNHHQGEEGSSVSFFGEEDSLFEDVKRIVLETKKASASFLQRRLRIGYARAARLIDMLEERGIVGPAEGAKPREVYGENVSAKTADLSQVSPIEPKNKGENEGEWQKV